METEQTVVATKRLAGSGDTVGAFVLHVANDGGAPIGVECSDALPAAALPLWHTLSATLNETEGGGGGSGYGVLRDVRLHPARRRCGEPRVEWSATLPAHSTLTVWIQFEKRLLHIDEQPSDASRGVDVPAAALRYRPAGAAAAEVRELYAEGGVMPIPLADRSMPYNVVMLTSTVVALFVGSMHNLLARPPALQVTAAGPPA